MRKDYMPCPWGKEDCQASWNGKCTALKKNADFGGRPCPFYKNCFQAEKAWLDTIARLVSLGKYEEAYRCADRGWLMFI